MKKDLLKASHDFELFGNFYQLKINKNPGG